ncbi:MAG: Gfo/Idh/MocA family oxidoreductase [Planctomycetaceae bacterium]|jgi:predicted dehydrogenase|nr:Gfo/Idh/MocA family oxidoreductase [Planctomycetaceae bacterium]
MSHQTTRRRFLKTSGLLTAGAALTSGLTIAQSAHAAGSDEIKIALIGCGGRGSSAVRDRAQVGDNFKVVAVADAFEDGAKNCAKGLRNDAGKDGSPLKGKVTLPEDNVFHGLDAYKKAIACLNPGDQVILASPPGFRPYHYRAAVEKGCHVFMEKPVCIDAPGFRHVMETNKMADEKGLKVVVGFQRRVEKLYYDWVKEIHAGKIGQVQFTRVYWNGSGIWCRNREPGEYELNFQIRNWYHFVWLCGDNIVEQHAHNLDIGNWIHGKGDKMAHPTEANAMGDRTIKAGPAALMRQAPPFSDRNAWDEWYQKNRGAFYRHGQAWDQFFAEYTYGDGSKMYSQCRHIKNTWNNVSESVYGTAGTGKPGHLLDLDSKNVWKVAGKQPKGAYQWEHDLLVKAVREGQPIEAGCDPYSAAMSCMTAVLGREAAFCGKVVKWDELVEKGKPYFPNGEITNWDQAAPVQPDADGFYESTVPVPGVYNPYAG